MQSRDILDTLVSLKEHIDREPRQPWVLLPTEGASENWARLGDEDKYWAIAIYYAPWHCQFVSSWNSEPNRHEVAFDRVTSEPVAVLREICNRFEMPGTTSGMARAVASVLGDSRRANFNVGVAGRGASVLPPEIQTFVRNVQTRSEDLSRRLTPHLRHSRGETA